MIYLDNCATTRMRKEVIEEIYRAMEEDFANPSSLHSLGIRAEKKLEMARTALADFLKVKGKEIFFTSGGTESNNIAIQSLIKKKKRQGKRIITSKIEHPSVLNIMREYEKKGFIVDYIKNDSYGNLDLEDFKSSLKEDTILVSLIHVNNELGVVQRLEEVRKIMDKSLSKAYLHIDGVQSFGKIELDFTGFRPDSFSFSSHKVHGPKGVGGLYIKEGLELEPIFFGGNQEKGLRSGTENLPSIIGFAEAVKILNRNFKNESKQIEEIRSYFLDKLNKEVGDIRINTDIKNSSPSIVNISFDNTRGQVLLHYLEEKQIYISTSSACSSKGTEQSHVLKAIGLMEKAIEGAIRICFSYENTKEEIDYLVENLKKSIEEIRRVMR